MLKKILACSVSHERIMIALFSCICLKDKLGLCLINCHVHPMTGNCSTSLRFLFDSLRVVFCDDRKSALILFVERYLVPAAYTKGTQSSAISSIFRKIFMISGVSHIVKKFKVSEEYSLCYQGNFSVTKCFVS